MKSSTPICIVIPTYWGRPQGSPPQPGDAVFDHPTPVDSESTLPRLLDSLTRMDSTTPYRVLILAAPIHPELAPAVEARINAIIAPFAPCFPTGQIGLEAIPLFREVAEQVGIDAAQITLGNYAGVRNMQLLACHALGAEVVIALDDDEVVPENYLRGALETMNQLEIYGAAGFYEDAEGDVYLPETPPTGNIFRDKAGIMNAASRQLLAAPDRWAPTPIAFGGNMLFRRALFTQVGFDPGITRGEDLDYVLNARLAGYTFWLDKSLRITHLPPGQYDGSPYTKLAEDVRRFVYEREKLHQAAARGLNIPPLDELRPYPGRFLEDDLESQALTALQAAAVPDIGHWGSPAEIVSKAITRAQQLAGAYFDFARRWPNLTRLVGDDKILHQKISRRYLRRTKN